MKKNLVIVESPAKARTLGKFLGKNYSLKASLGHIRDLPKSQLGIDIEKGFAPNYVVPREKRKIVTELRQAVKMASIVYLATDPDREGEAISWHLAKVTKSDHTPYRRVIFYEITKEAIKKAFDHPRPIDMQLVNAQQARRVLDRLVGYKISPWLWRKVRRGLSAGRVQSVTVRIIVDREREILKFVPVEYWTIEAELSKTPPTEAAAFRAMLIGLINGKKLAIPNQEEASKIIEKLKKASYGVIKVSTKKVTRQPAPPFITSTLQQEAWRKLHFSAQFTMAIAQQLYEGLPIGDEGRVGLITYMRTDSTRVSHSAAVEAREFVAERYGQEFLPPRARSFTRSIKGAQEAHEAIRPTKVWREPALVKPYLSNAQFKLYQLIWKRMVSSQMQAASFDNTTVDIEARCLKPETSYLFRTSRSEVTFPGFMVLYTESKDEAQNEEGKSAPFPHLEKGDALKLLGLFPEQHFTQPPPRLTEATLIKTLEQEGIGRPSTYAPTLATVQERGYVTKAKGVFQPSELGFIVTDLLIQFFPDIVDIGFTAQMENDLDGIANENKDWVNVIQNFYLPFRKSLENASLMERIKLPEEETEEVCPECGKSLVIRLGRYGKFLACSGFPGCKYTKSLRVEIGVNCPDCGSPILEKRNKRGRLFYGCSNYPNCHFATNFRPLPQPCPKCGGLLTQFRGKWVKCTKCDFKGKLEQD